MKLGTATQTAQQAAAEAPAAASNGKLGPGAVLDGRFAITETVRSGGMATIFKARDLENNGQFGKIVVTV